MGTALFKIGSDDNWGMTQAPQLIRTKISRTKRDNSEGQSGHWKSRLRTRSLNYTTTIEWNVQCTAVGILIHTLNDCVKFGKISCDSEKSGDMTMELTYTLQSIMSVSSLLANESLIKGTTFLGHILYQGQDLTKKLDYNLVLSSLMAFLAAAYIMGGFGYLSFRVKESYMCILHTCNIHS